VVNDLDILIQELEGRLEILNKQMPECIDEWDFDQAKSLKNPLILTRNQLHIVKNIKNPDNQEILKLKRRLKQIKKISEPLYTNLEGLVSEKILDNLKENYRNFRLKRIEKAEERLQELESKKPGYSIDNDIVLRLIDQLQKNEIGALEFKIEKRSIFYLKITNDSDEGNFQLSSKNDIEKAINQYSLRVLKKVGYNLETYSRTITHFSSIDPLYILEELSILFFEVFELYGKKIDVKII